jgi:indolepyruvate ferredoxin oxidoreductase beta subunit
MEKCNCNNKLNSPQCGKSEFKNDNIHKSFNNKSINKSQESKDILNSSTYESPYNIYICGVGGQGIIKTSIVIGEAAIAGGNGVVMSEIHGMAQRGGVVSTELKIGNSKSSIIQEGTADLLLAFEPLEAVRAVSKANKNTAIIFNTSSIMPFNISASENPYPELSDIIENLESKSNHVFAIDAEKIAKKAGHILSLNMVMLGAATAVEGFPLKKELILESMRNNLPEKSILINMNAFEDGFDFVKSKRD